MSSRLNYCNSCLSSIADTDLATLQRVQNRLALVVTKTPPFIHSVPLLRSLHWLPVKFRVDFKICLLTYKTLGGNNPPIYTPGLLLHCRHVHWDQTKGSRCLYLESRPMLGKGSFTSCIPSHCNGLAVSVRLSTSVGTFRKCLKTYLFDLAFPP